MADTFYSIDTLDSYRLYEIVYDNKSDFTYKIYNKKYGKKPLNVYTSKEDLHSMPVEEILDSDTYDIFLDFIEEHKSKNKIDSEMEGSLDDWYTKDLFGNIVRKNNTYNSRLFDYYKNDYYEREPETMDEEKVKELTKSDTIVFHLTDPSTTMLDQIYKGKGFDEVHSKLNTPTVKALLDAHDKIICLGHGSGYGLIGMFGPEVKDNFKNKNLFIIWCNADKYFSDPCFNGKFITGNMPSEVWECQAAGCGNITKELMLENITYWSKLCADAMPQCLNGEVASAVDYIRREYIKKYGDHPVTHYNSVRTMVHGDSYEKAENEVKAIENELNIHSDWNKYNSTREVNFNLRSIHNKDLDKVIDIILKKIDKDFSLGSFDLNTICKGDESFDELLSIDLLKELHDKYAEYIFVYDNKNHTITWSKK